MQKVSEILKEIAKTKLEVEFLPTGFAPVDEALDGGFLRKEIIIMGAFTGIGKSILAGQILYNIASKGFKCGYFSLEISNEMIVSRIIGQLANIKPSRVMSAKLSPLEIEIKSDAAAKVLMFDNMMRFSDDIYLLEEMIKEIKNNKCEFVVIDFIQNILLKNNMEEYQRLSFIAIQLQKIAKEHNACVLVLSQLSNKVGREGAKQTEYKGSGAIAMIADVGFFLKRIDPVLDPDGRPIGDQFVTLTLAKNRRGNSGQEWKLRFAYPGGKFSVE